MLLNLLVTVVLQNFTEVLLNDEAVLSYDDVQAFTGAWGALDPKATGTRDVCMYRACVWFICVCYVFDVSVCLWALNRSTHSFR